MHAIDLNIHIRASSLNVLSIPKQYWSCLDYVSFIVYVFVKVPDSWFQVK